MKQEPRVEPTPPEVAPTQEQFEVFARQLAGVRKAEYDKLETARKARRARRARPPDDA